MKLQPFAQHAQVLQIRALRHQVLTSNIANADTPNYKARDIDYAAAMKNAQSESITLRRTSELHSTGWNSARVDADLKYRMPMQSSLDGNTVETDVEQAQFAENAIRYRASLSFLNGSIKTLRFAIRGRD